MAEVKDWSGMMTRHATLLERRTGAGVAEWNERVRASGADADEAQLRAWLTEQGVTGYPQQLLVFERFGYPDFLTATAGDLIDAQYAGREELRPIFDAVVAAVQDLGEVTIQARKGYVSFVTPRRTFAAVRPTTRDRVDIGLRLPGREPAGRLEPSKGLGNDVINVRVSLRSVSDLDDEVIGFLRAAYDKNV